MTAKYTLPEKDLLGKVAAIKGFEYSSLGKEFKKQISVAEKQYQKLSNNFESNKNEEVKIWNQRISAESNLVYNIYFIFYKYYKINEFFKRSLGSKLTDSNCDGVVLKINLSHQFQWPQEGLNWNLLHTKELSSPLGHQA